MHHAYGLAIPETLADACDPARTALIVYDMQVGILRQMRDGTGITARVAEVLAAAREAGLRVFFLRHLSLPKPLMGVFQLRQAMMWQRTDNVDEVQPWFLRGSEGFKITPELAPRDDEAVFDKITMSAFEGTPLDIALRDCGLNSFVLVGVATEIGLEPTVRHGADLGYLPIVVTDACGAGHEEAGERAIASLRFMGDAFFTDIAELTALLQQQD
ncbi:MAG: cysteine hydrolase [Rhodothermaceae bacterium]|nr:cysteine hydrolase [Rhodothermaceae bacterium]